MVGYIQSKAERCFASKEQIEEVGNQVHPQKNEQHVDEEEPQMEVIDLD